MVTTVDPSLKEAPLTTLSFRQRSRASCCTRRRCPAPTASATLDPVAYAWVDALARAGQKWWQVLPLGPTSFGDSPYQSLSTFAGNTNLLSPEALLHDGLLDHSDLAGVQFPDDRVDFEPVIQFKNRLLTKAWQNFQAGRGGGCVETFDAFCGQHQHGWLDDFALFRALKDAHGNRTWQEWPARAGAARRRLR